MAQDREKIVLCLIRGFSRFLRPAQFFLALFGGGDVHVGSTHPQRLTALVVKDATTRSHVPDGAVEIDNSKINVDRFLPCDRDLCCLLEERAIVGMNNLEE